MKKILVPVDFSNGSFTAFYYGYQLAKEVSAAITLLYVLTESEHNIERLAVVDDDDVLDRIQNKMDVFLNEYPMSLGVEIDLDIIQRVIKSGDASDEISNFAFGNNFDLIVMGTSNNISVFRRFLGSVSSVVVRSSNCPVLLIPEHTQFHIPQLIVFALDKYDGIGKSIETYSNLNNLLNADTEFVHVYTGDPDEMSGVKDEVVEELFKQGDPKYSITIKAIEGVDVYNTLISYAFNVKADIIAVIHKKNKKIYDVFGKSVSGKFIHNTPLPIIIFPHI